MLTSFFASQKGKVRDRIVLIGKPAVIPVNLNPPAKRQSNEQAAQRYGLNPRPFAFPTPSPTPTPAPNAPRPLSSRQIDEQLDAFLKANGALVRVNDAWREFRQVRACNNRSFDASKVVPTGLKSKGNYTHMCRF